MNKIFFFNGWGMDENLLAHLKNSTEYKIEIINFPYELDAKKILEVDIFIGYSFGVYYLNKFLNEHRDIKFKKAIGINGLPQTIGKFGINPKMFDMTLETLNEENLEKFLINMDIDENFVRASKSFAEVKDELQYFKNNYQVIENNFINFYFIGRNDRIIPANKLEKFCQTEGFNYKIIDCGHYPFSYFEDFVEIISCGEF